MERSLLDTNVLSEVLKGRHGSICSNAESYLSVIGRFTLSVITVAELVDGFRRKRRDAEIERLLAKLETEAHEILRAYPITVRREGDRHNLLRVLRNLSQSPPRPVCDPTVSG